MILRPAAFALAFWLAAAASAPPAGAQTIEETLALAYENNPQLLAERARLRASDENVAQAVSGWRPQVVVNGDLGRSRTDRSPGFINSGINNTNPTGANIQLTQNVYRGGRTVAATEGAEAQVEADRARLLAIEQQVFGQAITAYANVVRDQAVVELNVNNERVLERQLEATRDRFRVGEVTRTDVAQAESRLSRAISDRVAAEGVLIQSRANYQRVVGVAPGKLEPAPPFAGLPANEGEAVELARGNAYTVVQAKFTEDAARARVREVTGELLPQVTVDAAASHREDSIGDIGNTESMSVVARLRIPLYQSGSVSSRIRQAKQVAGQRRNELNDQVRAAVENATRAWEGVQTARSQIESFTAEVRAARIALEGVRQEATVGSRTVLDVLDAEQELLDAQVGLVRARRNEIVATADLRAAIGTLTAEALKVPVKLYDFTEHYQRVRDKWYGWSVPEEEQ